MQFFSIEFALAFLVFLSLYWASIKQILLNKLLTLLFGWFILYAFNPQFLYVNIVFSIFIFLLATIIQKVKLKFFLFLFIFLSIIFLIFFKYYSYLVENFKNIILNFKFDFLISDNTLIPIGISFYTLLAICLLTQAYKDKQFKVELLDTMLYLSFFATIVSGPIFKADEFKKKINTHKKFGNENFIFALITMAIIKKVLIANKLNEYLPLVFNDPSAYDISILISSLFGYSFMLYCDFSGYIDLVTAIALCMGIELPKNFNKPFASKNLRDFWRKWHISLTLFLKDYIYIPLGGNKNGFIITQINVLIVFIISGIWHGNGFNFFIWGALHGLGIIFLNVFNKVDILKFDFLKRVITFSYISILWLFFAMNFSSSMEYINAIIHNNFGIKSLNWFIFVPIIAFVYFYPKINMVSRLKHIYSNMPTVFLIVLLCEIIFLVYLLMPSGMPNFIYQEF